MLQMYRANTFFLNQADVPKKCKFLTEFNEEDLFLRLNLNLKYE